MLRKSTEKDIPQILDILESAKLRMYDSNIPQWQSGYPNEMGIREDISKGRSFVYILDDEIVATAVLDFDPDPNYTIINKGNWINNNGSYASIHRIASADAYIGKGIAQECIEALLSVAKNNNMQTVRIDTHELNVPMRKLIEKIGFQERGVIYIAFENNSPRIAYEREL